MTTTLRSSVVEPPPDPTNADLMKLRPGKNVTQVIEMSYENYPFESEEKYIIIGKFLWDRSSHGYKIIMERRGSVKCGSLSIRSIISGHFTGRLVTITQNHKPSLGF